MILALAQNSANLITEGIPIVNNQLMVNQHITA
jgi:hypothetical protein